MCFQITLTQGLNLQIRRMCKALGYRVLRLQRIQIMDFYLADLSVGQLHQLSELQTQQLLVKLDGSVSDVH